MCSRSQVPTPEDAGDRAEGGPSVKSLPDGACKCHTTKHKHSIEYKIRGGMHKLSYGQKGLNVVKHETTQHIKQHMFVQEGLVFLDK